MAIEYISWTDAADVAAYLRARDLARLHGNSFRCGDDQDPASSDVPRRSTHVLLSRRQADGRRWQEALEKAQRLGLQPFITDEDGDHDETRFPA
jgi:hypothetical protein